MIDDSILITSPKVMFKAVLRKSWVLGANGAPPPIITWNDKLHTCYPKQ